MTALSYCDGLRAWPKIDTLLEDAAVIESLAGARGALAPESP
jgi:hypothetical protein